MPVSLNERIAYPLANKLSLKSLRNNDLGLGVSNPYAQDVFNILSKFGTDAHMFVPGPGVPILGPETLQGTWSQVAEITASGSGQAATLTFNNAPAGAATNNSGGLVFTPNKAYQVTYTISGYAGGSVYFQSASGGYTGQARSANGTYTETITPTGTAAQWVMKAASAGTTCVVSNISVKEILGYTNYLNGFAAGNYLESTGNTNAAVDGAVGLVLDAAGSVGPELCPPLAPGNGWNTGTQTTLSSGSVSVANSASSQPFLYKGILTVGKMYEITYTISSITAGNFYTFVGSAATGPARTTPGTYTDRIVCAGNGNGGLACNIGTTGTITSVSYKEVTGTHATQTTTANKPTLRRGILNQALWSGDFSNSAWIKQSLNLSAAGDNPPTGSTGQLLTSTGSFAATAPASAIAASAGQSVTMAFEVKAGPGATLATLVDETQGGTCYAQVTLATGAVGSTGFVTSASSVDLGNGWWLVAATYTVQAGKTSVLPRSWVGAYSGANTAGQSIKVGRVGLFQGALTAAQIIAAGGIPLTTTAPASSQYGAYAWEFDGGNDWVTGSAAPFQHTDDFVAVVAASNRASTGYPTLFAVNGTAPAKINLFLAGGVPYVEFIGSAGNVGNTLTDQKINTPFVLAAKKVGSVIACRLDGIQRSTITTTSVTSATLTGFGIGANADGSGNKASGQIFGVIAIKGTVSDAELRVLEKWLGSIAGVPIA